MSSMSFESFMDQLNTERQNGLRECMKAIGKTVDEKLEKCSTEIRVAKEEVNVIMMKIKEDEKHLEAERKRLVKEKEVQNTTNARLTEMEHQLQRMKKELEEREKKFREKEKELEEKDKKLRDMKEELKNWDKELMRKDGTVAELEVKVTMLQKEHKQEVAIANERIENRENQLRTHEDQLKKSEELNNARKVELEEWSIELEEKQKKSVAREEAISEREKDLDDREGLLNLAEQELQDKEAAFEKRNKSTESSWSSFIDHVDSCFEDDCESIQLLQLQKVKRIATILQAAMPDQQLVIRSRYPIEMNAGFMENENPDSIAVIATETGLEPLKVLINLTNQVRSNLLSHHSSASDKLP